MTEQEFQRLAGLHGMAPSRTLREYTEAVERMARHPAPREPETPENCRLCGGKGELLGKLPDYRIYGCRQCNMHFTVRESP